ncbi:HAD family hydrolase [Oceaniglobus indicus]|uniref:HAD family hydrolase n=1 Tax=Oceaniglobus indicus TaxID=2047749 RepID=UPI001F4F0DF7|nr:HAD-IA family hydrolase [Oceaniglobus indicus]
MPALLFDLDGTLIHSDPLHAQVFAELLADHGRIIDEAYYLSHLHGRHNSAIFGDLLPDEDAQALSDQKEAMFRDRLGASVPATPGAVALLDHAAARGWPVAVVTNAPRANADAMLGAIGLGDRFSTVIIGGECSAGKPDPAPYLAALAQLGADPAKSLAFEDSPSGIRAAVGAGLFTYGIRSSLPGATLADAGAAACIDDFNDTALWDHLRRLEGHHP